MPLPITDPRWGMASSYFYMSYTLISYTLQISDFHNP